MSDPSILHPRLAMVKNGPQASTPTELYYYSSSLGYASLHLQMILFYACEGISMKIMWINATYRVAFCTSQVIFCLQLHLVLYSSWVAWANIFFSQLFLCPYMGSGVCIVHHSPYLVCIHTQCVPKSITSV